ncbi:MAG: hypothetical protein ACRDJE_10860 [Dehalococcoidia bacterium]
MKPWLRLLVGLVAITGLLSVALFTHWLFSPPNAVGLPSCLDTMPLTPVEEPGAWWARHRRSLALPADALDDEGTSALVLWNQRTNDIFAVDPEADVEVQDGWVYFGVHTRYAIFVNRRWNSDPWVLCIVGRTPDFT